MAGTLPGVPSRRTIIHHRLEDLPIFHRELLSSRQRLEPWTTWTTTFDNMNETTVRDRRWLEQKLGCLGSPSRQSEFQANEGGGWKHRARTKDTGLGSKILGSPRQFHLNSSKSDSGVCAVCLEDFGAEEQVMDLSCSHKYHSKCLLPWLAAHPHCPYCRRPVGS